VEEAFARAVRSRTDGVRLRRCERAAAEFTPDDPHGALFPLAARTAAAGRPATAGPCAAGLATGRTPSRLAAEGFSTGLSAEGFSAVAARRAVAEGAFAFRARLAVAA